jgi:hypothetical protein
MGGLNLYAIMIVAGLYVLVRSFMAGANLAGQE